MAIQYIDQLNEEQLERQNVLARFDFNVPLNSEDQITDTSRIDNSLETIKFVLENGCKQLILMSHLGRPKSIDDKKFSLLPVAQYLAKVLDQDVLLTEASTGKGIKELARLGQHKIILLENLRFHSEEKNNNTDFARSLSEFADIYVNDAFGVSHREHASVHEIVRYFPRKAYAGFLIQKEIKALDIILNKPEKPFIGVIGGAKVSDKIKTIEKLLTSVDKLLIGGAMAYPFLKAKGKEVGKSLCSDHDVNLASQILRRDVDDKITLPVDHICSTSPDGEADEKQEIPAMKMGLDIGPMTLKSFGDIIRDSKTILWNGPMGLFENPKFSQGTMELAKLIAKSDAYSLVGGGDSVSAVNKSGVSENFSHISTGGGASLEYIEKTDLPGLRVLKFGL